MSEYHEMVKEAAEARIGADRMALGLSCIPDPLRGDMAEIERLNGLVRLLDNDDAAPLLTEAAAFLDALAEQMERWTRPPGAGEAAADCRAKARELRGEV